MAALVFETDELTKAAHDVAKAVIAELDLPAIVAGACKEAARMSRFPAKKRYSATEVCQITGWTLCALRNRRYKNKITGFKGPGDREYMYTREEVERVTGLNLG